MSEQKGAVSPASNGVKKAIIDLLEKTLDTGIFDAVVIPMQTPSKDAFAYILVQDKSLLKDCDPLPPAMFIQGAKAVSSITRLGHGNMKIAAVMRPCEVRAAIELAKLGQTNIEHMTLISMDCPGVLPTSDFLADPKKGIQQFEKAAMKFDYTIMRPVCQICDKSSMVAGDIHIGTLGAQPDTILIIAHSHKGNEVVEQLGFKLDADLKPWSEKVNSITMEKHKKRTTAHTELQSKVGGIDNLVENLSHCINCHNCMKACPICVCRLCYFDSDKVKLPSQDYLEQAERKGSIRFLPDTTLFHLGRMMHMSISCVSCGACEDACPVSIPVAQIFSMIADKTQGLFTYVSGRSLDEQIPLVSYKEEELCEVEDAHD